MIKMLNCKYRRCFIIVYTVTAAATSAFCINCKSDCMTWNYIK